MTAREELSLPAGVESLPGQPRSTLVSDELGKLMALLRASCPSDAVITFLYDGALHVRIDVRTLEEVVAIELMLPRLAAGVFHGVQRGRAPNHSFLHRVTALVER